MYKLHENKDIKKHNIDTLIFNNHVTVGENCNDNHKLYIIAFFKKNLYTNYPGSAVCSIYIYIYIV